MVKVKFPAISKKDNDSDKKESSSEKQKLSVKELEIQTIWSWLRMNAGGVPNTCKSSEKLITDASVEVMSGKRRTGE